MYIASSKHKSREFWSSLPQLTDLMYTLISTNFQSPLGVFLVQACSSWIWYWNDRRSSLIPHLFCDFFFLLFFICLLVFLFCFLFFVSWTLPFS